jgi:DNA-binding MarR family transcriptional regulator
MKKQCTKCQKCFPEGDAEFDRVRFLGACSTCTPETSSEVEERLGKLREVDEHLRKLSEAMVRGVKRTVTSGPQQISLITIIRFGPCPVGDVAEFVGLDQSSITLHLKKFEAEGLVTVTRGSDKRHKMVEATEKAREIYRIDV